MIYTVLLTLVWIVNLFNGTGLDSVYHVTDFAQIIVIVLTFAKVFCDGYRKNKIRVARKDFYLFGSMAVVFFASSFVHGYGMVAKDYLWMYCLIYLIAQLPMNERTFRWVGLIYGVLGGAILFIFDYGSALSGWNANSIAMLGMHSYLIFIIPFFKPYNIKNKVFLLMITAVFAFLIYPTDSRSGILFAILAALFALSILPRKWILGGKGRLWVWLTVPLLIAVFIAVISQTGIKAPLEVWSYQKFNKPIFNGRDDLWIWGFEVLFSHLLFGTGNLMEAGWHNSAVVCLVAYGCVGYLLWVGSFSRILEPAQRYYTDYLVSGCVISFIILYVQQSVELGFISTSPSLLAYVILGLMLGRIKYLNQNLSKIREKANVSAN